jgi:hypothetical protein
MQFIQKLLPWCCGVDSPPSHLSRKPVTNRIISNEHKDLSITTAPPPLLVAQISAANFLDSMSCLDHSRAIRKDQYQG